MLKMIINTITQIRDKTTNVKIWKVKIKLIGDRK